MSPSLLAGCDNPTPRSLGRSLRHLLLGVVLACAVPAMAAAQGASDATPLDVKQAYDDSFQAMLADPGNLDKTFLYAELAIKTGDIEGAISARERMLFVDPDLPRVRLELGVLYFRIGSYAAAKNYFASVLETMPAAPDSATPDEVRNKAVGFMTEIDNRNTRHHLSGSLFAAVKRQTNANTATATGDVLVSGIPARLGDESTKKRDDNAFAALSFKYSYDMSENSSDTWDVNMTTYMSAQAGQKQLDVRLMEVTTGPVLILLQSDDYGAVLRPYAIFTFLNVGHARDHFAPGAGAAFTFNPLSGVQHETVVEFRDRRFRDNFKAPTKTNRNGIEAQYRTKLTWEMFDNFSINAGIGMTVGNAKDEPSASTEYSSTLGASLSLPSPLPFLSMPWSTALSVTRALTKFDAPDGTISATDFRLDHDWRFSLTEAVPINDTYVLVTTLARTVRVSTLPNFQYTNDSLTVGLSMRF